jgi:hypothetical protein
MTRMETIVAGLAEAGPGVSDPGNNYKRGQGRRAPP